MADTKKIKTCDDGAADGASPAAAAEAEGARRSPAATSGGRLGVGAAGVSGKEWLEDGKKYFKYGNIGGAKLCFEGFMEDGRLLVDLSVMERRRYELEDSKPLFERASDWFGIMDEWYKTCRSWEERLENRNERRRDIEWFQEGLSTGYHLWGRALAYLARIAALEFDNAEAVRLFGLAIGNYWKAVNTSWENRGSGFYDLGVAHYRRFMAGEDQKDEDEAKECFMKSGKDVMGILVDLDDDAAEDLSDGELLYGLLDRSESEESRFFGEMTQGMDEDEKDEYKNIYIRSIYIVSRLKLNGIFETEVANYQSLEFAQKMLFDDQRFCLRDVDHSTDKLEGKVLLRYLFGGDAPGVDEEKAYGAFTGCFTFAYDNLAHYQAFGKERKDEGEGLSVVFDRDFFGGHDGMARGLKKKKSKGRYEKFGLYRCVYFDTVAGQVVSVGQVDQEFFDRDHKGEYPKYTDGLDNLVERLDKKLQELKDWVERDKLDQGIVAPLLIRLRYLIKDVSRKNEQECRIVKICHLSGEKKEVSVSEDGYSLFVAYKPKVSDYVNRIYFGPKAEGKAKFQDFLKYKDLDIPCDWSRSKTS